jgi:hypothetical protein
VRLVARFAAVSLFALAAFSATREARAQETWMEQAELRASDAIANGQFGWSVAVSGDTVLIGAPAPSSGGIDTSGAYVFTYDGAGKWLQKQKLTNPLDATTVMGRAVALTGNDAFVAHDDGSITQFSQANGLFLLAGTVLSVPRKTGDVNFIEMVAQGDTLVASGDTIPQGSVRVFNRLSDGDWVKQQDLKPPPEASTDYGWSLALDGDTVIVGDRSVSTAVCNSCGAAFVFTRSQGVWSYQATLAMPNAQTGANFGQGVGIHGDQAVIGATGVFDASAGTSFGAVFTYSRSGGTWSAGSLLPMPSIVIQAGGAIGLTADTSISLVNAVNDPSDMKYHPAPGLWVISASPDPTHPVILQGHNVTSSDWFGQGLAIDGPTIVAGAPNKTRDQIDEGEAYIFRRGTALGQACGQASECPSGFCVDGVCCDQACGYGDGQDCQACSYAHGGTKDGTCGPASTTIVCHDAMGSQCDNDTHCDGIHLTCPADVTKPDNTACTSGVCYGGLCTGEAPPGVDAGIPNPAPLALTSPGSGCAESSGSGDAAIVAIAGAVVGLSFVRRRRRG